MIVFDASSLVGAALKRDSVPAQALLKARAIDRLAMSRSVEAELRRVLLRRKFDRYLPPEDRDEFIGFVLAAVDRFDPGEKIADCPDPDDNKYLELAIAAHAGIIVSSDMHLLAMSPWRGVRIMRPAVYLARVEPVAPLPG